MSRDAILKLQELVKRINVDVWNDHPLPEHLYAAILELDERLSAIESGLRAINEALQKEPVR